jgi:uncharacterized delta-60 repeat protein
MFTARIVAVLATLIFTQMARAYPGAPDPSFGFAGVTYTPISSAMPHVASGNRVVVVGGGPNGGAAARHQENGGLDLSFGVNGVAATAPVVYPTASALQADGKIVVAGGMEDPTAFTIRRLDADGQPDGSFVSTAIPFRPLVMSALADGRLMVAGYVFDVSGSLIGLARYDAQGAPDPSFGVGGFVLEPDDLFPAAMVVRDDGAVIIAGGHTTPETANTLAVARYDDHGRLDPTFGVGGVATVDFGTSTFGGIGLVRQDDGKLVVAADSGHGPATFLLAGFDADGTLDPTFGDAGLVVGPAGALARALVRQSDGKLVVVGNILGPSNPVRLVRYLANGTVDGDFGIDGVSDADHTSFLSGAALDAQERVVVSGSQFVARFLTDGASVTYCQPGPGQSAQCDDGNPCTLDSCDGFPTGVCTHRSLYPSSCEVDGNECTAGFCSPSGECIENVLGPVACSDDGDPCTLDHCAVTDAASHAVGCVHDADYDFACEQPLVPRSATLSVVDAPGTGRGDRLRFRWSHGDATKADFGSPVSGTSYRLCAFQLALSPAGSFDVVFGAQIAAAETCTTSACWRERARGWKFRSGSGDPDGVVRLVLNEGQRAGMSRIDVKGVGPALTVPSLPIAATSPLYVQLHSSDGRCWGAHFQQFTRNTAVAFDARSD